MFEKEVERLRKRLRSSLTVQQPTVSLASVLANEDVEHTYKVFFRAEVEWWVYEERQNRKQNTRFDWQHHLLQELEPQITNSSIQAAQFDSAEQNALIDAAVKTRVNYICRPRTTLTWFVFRGAPTKPLTEILLRLEYFSEYTYLLEGFKQWARSRKRTGNEELLSVVEFERIITDIDNDAILDMSAEEFLALLTPVYALFAEANPDLPPETVPTEAIIIFLDDKVAIPISQALEDLLYREELKTLTRTKLMQVVDEVIDKAEAQAQPTQIPEVQPIVVNIPEYDPVVVNHNTSLQEAGIEVISENIEASDNNRPIAAENIPQPMPEVPKVVPQNEVAEETEDTALQIRLARYQKIVDESSREKFIRRLFAKQEEQYQGMLEDVLAAQNWKEAASRLDRWFISQGAEPNSAVAMELSLALRRSYVTV